MLLDVEGAEEIIMRGFPFDEFDVRVMSVERSPRALVELLKKHGLEEVATLGRMGEVVFIKKNPMLISWREPDNSPV